MTAISGAEVQLYDIKIMALIRLYTMKIRFCKWYCIRSSILPTHTINSRVILDRKRAHLIDSQQKFECFGQST